jgi:hypothetical protein
VVSSATEGPLLCGVAGACCCWLGGTGAGLFLYAAESIRIFNKLLHIEGGTYVIGGGLLPCASSDDDVFDGVPDGVLPALGVDGIDCLTALII